MSPGHVYHYFDSKEQIIAEMVRAHSGEKREMVERFEAAGDKLVDHMVDNLEESIDSSTDPFWSALTLEMAAEATRNPEIAEVLRSTDCEIKSRVVACLAGQSGLLRLRRKRYGRQRGQPDRSQCGRSLLRAESHRECRRRRDGADRAPDRSSR